MVGYLTCPVGAGRFAYRVLAQHRVLSPEERKIVIEVRSDSVRAGVQQTSHYHHMDAITNK